jgi:hypothetical protein
MLYIKNLHGMVMDIALWTMITLPAGLVYALVSRVFIHRQFGTASGRAAVGAQLEASLR